jgi:sugar O-acyltransferase (sialic acid O-acetyltransferase NeuD family)
MPARRDLIIVGCGGHGRSVAEAVEMADAYQLVGFVDDSWSQQQAVWQFPVLGALADLESLRQRASVAIVAIGNNGLRQSLTDRLVASGFELATVVHPMSRVSPRAVIGPGSALMAGCIVGTEALLGRGVIVNSGAVIDHHCQVGDFGHLGVGASMAGGSVLGPGAWMQAGTALGYGVNVPAGEILAPGEARR